MPSGVGVLTECSLHGGIITRVKVRNLFINLKKKKKKEKIILTLKKDDSVKAVVVKIRVNWNITDKAHEVLK